MSNITRKILNILILPFTTSLALGAIILFMMFGNLLKEIVTNPVLFFFCVVGLIILAALILTGYAILSIRLYMLVKDN